jgi:hypothetical protein
MRINEILTESQLQQLDEGPIGSALGAVGRGIGKVAGGVAKGIGAVAGGVVGAGRAMKKGYQSGKAFVGDDPDPNKGQPGYDGSAAAPASGGAAPASGGAAPAAGGGAPAAAPTSSTTPPTAQDINAQGPAGTAPAKAQTGAAGQALAKTTAVVDKQQAQSQEKANQTVYAQVKANVDKLDKKGKQRILQLLQKSVAAPAAGAAPAGGAAAAPAATQGASPAAGGTGSGFNPDTGKPFASAADRAAYDASPAAKMPTADVEKAAGGAAPAPAAPAAPANTMANAPVSATNTAAADNPNQPPPKKTGGKVAGQVSQTPGAIAKREKRQAAASAKSTGNKVFGQMANTLQQQNASKNNYGNALSEALALRVEAHKQKMFETGLSQGTISVFRK